MSLVTSERTNLDRFVAESGTEKMGHKIHEPSQPERRREEVVMACETRELYVMLSKQSGSSAATY